MMKNLFLLSFFFACTCLHAQNLELVEFASGFSSPVDISNAGDDRLFITERDGTVKILNADGSSGGTFLDIDNMVTSCGGGCEIGLLGLAFHPDFAENGFFYVNYTAVGGGNTHISRFSVAANNPSVADPNSEVLLFNIPQPYGNHNGGCIKFGPDGYLYIGMGDGGSGGDPQAFSQNRQSLLGKMLRVDVDNGSPYSIPADNPFANDDETLDEIWSIGLRNPWRFSFDRETGDMWIADVGQNEWEEIDFEPAGSPGGVNYGWRCREGFETFNNSNCPPASQLTDPVHVYETSSGFGQGCSVTGGFVYRGCDFPEFYGKYIYGDYCSSRIWALTNNGDGTFSNEELLNYDNNEISGFGEDINGELYMAAIGEGKIYRVTETSNPLEVSATVTNISCNGGTDGAINLTVPDGSTFTWSNNADTEDLSNLPAGEYTVTVTTAAGCEKTQTFNVNEPEQETFTIVNTAGVLMLSGAEAEVNWILNGEIVASGTMFTPTVSGDYSATFTDENGCEAVSNVLSVTVSGVDNLEAAINISVSPNPFTAAVQLDFDAIEAGNFTLRILNTEGKEMYREKISGAGNTAQTVDLSTLPAGVYFLHLGNDDGEFIEKLVKE